MERSGSQKALLVFSIIEIVGAVLIFLTGILLIVGVGALGSASSADLAAAGVSASNAGLAAGVGSMVAILCIIMAIWSLLCGIFGIRAANDSTKVGIVWVFTLIDLILCVIGIIVAIAQGTFQWSLVFSLIPAAIMFWLANNIKKLNA